MGAEGLYALAGYVSSLGVVGMFIAMSCVLFIVAIIDAIICFAVLPMILPPWKYKIDNGASV